MKEENKELKSEYRLRFINTIESGFRQLSEGQSDIRNILTLLKFSEDKKIKEVVEQISNKLLTIDRGYYELLGIKKTIIHGIQKIYPSKEGE